MINYDYEFLGTGFKKNPALYSKYGNQLIQYNLKLIFYNYFSY